MRLYPVVVLCVASLIASCSNRSAPGLDSPSYSNDHSTAAGGFGLGPEDWRTNGGAFGPDTGSR